MIINRKIAKIGEGQYYEQTWSAILSDLQAAWQAATCPLYQTACESLELTKIAWVTLFEQLPAII